MGTFSKIRVKQYNKKEKIMLGVNKYQNSDAQALKVKSGKGEKYAPKFLSNEINQ